MTTLLYSSCAKLCKHQRLASSKSLLGKSVLVQSVRFQSANAQIAESCPFSGRSKTNSNQPTSSYPSLKHVPSYPFVGSLIPALSGIPDINSDPYSFWRELRSEFGDFYTLGLPGLGSKKNSKGTMYVVSDPREMIKVIRAGGAFPWGMAQMMWVNGEWNELRGISAGGIMKEGEEWKRIRSFLQTDLLHPKAARGYIPGMIEAAKIASRAAPFYKDKLNTFFNYTSFDLFSSAMLGELTMAVDPNSEADSENRMFAESVVQGLSTAIKMNNSPIEHILKNVGFSSKSKQHAFNKFDVVLKTGRKKILNFTERKENGELNQNEKNSYLYRAIERQKADGSNVTMKEAQDAAFIGLFAAVDTTSAILGWNVFHIARNQEIQQILYEELSDAIATIGNGDLTVDVFDKRHTPYLHACIRETQRLTPAAALFSAKKCDKDLEINGVKLEKGDVVGLDGYSILMDPTYIESPNEYRPERWLSSAVESRKGTEKEIVDHPYFKEPFSQGARKCPGSRVASNETLVLLAQLVLDWNLTTEAKTMNDIKYHQQTLVELEVPTIEFECRNSSMKDKKNMNAVA